MLSESSDKLLFEEKQRKLEGPAPHIHNEYDYYNESSRVEIGVIRELLNGWFAQYPEAYQHELKRRFIKGFSAPFFELFLHELLRQQGFELLPHPELETTKKRPEFLVRGSGIEFYVEAKEVTAKSDSEGATENLTNVLYDQLNRIDTPNFLFNVRSVVFKSGKQPSGKKVIRYFEDALPQFDADVVENRIRSFGMSGIPDLHSRMRT